ncbi:hypothetical protein JCM19238_3663 [Vibrio ponticus]|nr:hypothetical protein JCM19238_3663 [Vibrio ponticus]
MHLDATYETRVVESSDNDSLYLDTTVVTESIEGLDPDEIVLAH